MLSDFRKIASLVAGGARIVVRGTRAGASRTSQASQWTRRRVGAARRRGGAGDTGMMRLLDLHAASCAGDTLVTIGLAGTIFFGVAASEARGRVALYLLVTMVPFALLAPVIGPVLDRARHGRRYALAATMLGRALLAWLIADNLVGLGLYPAAFGVLALSRAYGVARSAAVPRLLPPGLDLSQAGARASVYATVAGAVVAPIGAAAFWFGPQWPLRAASLVFVAGSIIAIRLPPRADSEPPQRVPKIFHVPWRHRTDAGDRLLAGPTLLAAMVGAASVRAIYGFLALFLAFAVRSGGLSTRLWGSTLGQTVTVGLIGASFAIGAFGATVAGTRLRILRPTRFPAIGLAVVAVLAIWAATQPDLIVVATLCLATAAASGVVKLALDATIQERVADEVRASTFAHAETLLMLAWVAGGALGLIPLNASLGLAVVAVATLAAALRAGFVAWRLRADRSLGRAPIPSTRITAEPPGGHQPVAPTLEMPPPTGTPAFRAEPDSGRRLG